MQHFARSLDQRVRLRAGDVEIEAIDTLFFGLDLLARVPKGTVATCHASR